MLKGIQCHWEVQRDFVMGMIFFLLLGICSLSLLLLHLWFYSFFVNPLFSFMSVNCETVTLTKVYPGFLAIWLPKTPYGTMGNEFCICGREQMNQQRKSFPCFFFFLFFPVLLQGLNLWWLADICIMICYRQKGGKNECWAVLNIKYTPTWLRWTVIAMFVYFIYWPVLYHCFPTWSES